MLQPGQLLHQLRLNRLPHHRAVLFQALMPRCDPSSPNLQPFSILLLHGYPLAIHLDHLRVWVTVHHPVAEEVVVREVHWLEALGVALGVRRCLA